MKLNSICVYCGSASGHNGDYAEQARQLGQVLAERSITLVYGGSNIGLMGILADTVLAAKGQVIGVMPKALVAKEVAHLHLTQLHVVDSMHERKALMVELSDGFIAMPGGVGTLDELFEVWTWGQLGFHDKPCGLLNAASYYDPLATFLDHATAEGFIKEPHRHMLMIAGSPEALLSQFEGYVPPRIEKVIHRNET
jgi:uncharacterized protein (TIGR00730 family)